MKNLYFATKIRKRLAEFEYHQCKALYIIKPQENTL